MIKDLFLFMSVPYEVVYKDKTGGTEEVISRPFVRLLGKRVAKASLFVGLSVAYIGIMTVVMGTVMFTKSTPDPTKQ